VVNSFFILLTQPAITLSSFLQNFVFKIVCTNCLLLLLLLLLFLYKYLGVIFDTSGTDDKEIRSRVMQARKFIACLNGILWSKDIRKERQLNIYNALIKNSLLYGSETWRLTKNNKRRVVATEMDAFRRSSRISRKERIRNVTIRQQIGLEEPIIE